MKLWSFRHLEAFVVGGLGSGFDAFAPFVERTAPEKHPRQGGTGDTRLTLDASRFLRRQAARATLRNPSATIEVSARRPAVDDDREQLT
jgi:hypothetical protein